MSASEPEAHMLAPGLHWPRWWQAIGWLGAVGIAVVSLLPMPDGALDVPGSDKFGHLFAYFLLTFGHTQLGLRPAQMFARAAGFMLMGVLLEYLQASTGYRSYDPRDMVANGLGIVFGLVIGTSMPGWLVRTERRLLALRERWRR